MKSNTVIYTCLILFFFLTYGTTFGETQSDALPWYKSAGLAGLIEKAYDNNFSLKSMENKIDALSAKSVFDGSLTDPKIGLAIANIPTDDFKLDKEPMTQKQIFVSQTVPWYGKRAEKQHATAIEAEILREKLKKKKLTLAQLIATDYYELGYLNRALQTNTRLTGRLEKVKNVALAVYRSGKGMQHSLFQIEVELGTLQEERTALLNAFNIKKIKINELINSRTLIDIKPPALPEFHQIRLNAEDLKQLALSHNPDINILKHQRKQSDIRIALAQKDYYPDTTMKVSYGQREDDRTDFFSVSATINIPLFQKSRQDKHLTFTRKTKDSVENTFQFVTTTLPYQIESLVDQIHKACDQHLLYENSIIPQAEKWSESALNDYKVGKIDFNAMIQANIKEMKYKLKKEQFQFDIMKKFAMLSELTGDTL